jgi:hypothetical protein
MLVTAAISLFYRKNVKHLASIMIDLSDGVTMPWVGDAGCLQLVTILFPYGRMVILQPSDLFFTHSHDASPTISAFSGGVGERFNPPVLKTGAHSWAASSNLAPSAILKVLSAE